MTVSVDERSNRQWVALLRADGSPQQQAAFCELSDKLYRVLCTYVGRRSPGLPALASLNRQEQEALAADFTQEALLAIYQKLDQYNESGTFLGWAITVATRIAGEGLRRAHWHSPRLPHNWGENTEDGQGTYPLNEPFDSKQHSLEKQMLLQAVISLINQTIEDNLSVQQRTAFLARFRDDLTHEEIAEATGVAPSVIYQRIHQARLKIKRRLQEAGYEIDEFL